MYVLHEIMRRLRDNSRRDALCRFASILSFVFPGLVYALYILSRRLDNMRRDIRRRLPSVLSCGLPWRMYAKNKILTRFRDDRRRDARRRFSRVVSCGFLSLRYAFLKSCFFAQIGIAKIGEGFPASCDFLRLTYRYIWNLGTKSRRWGSKTLGAGVTTSSCGFPGLMSATLSSWDLVAATGVGELGVGLKSFCVASLGSCIPYVKYWVGVGLQASSTVASLGWNTLYVESWVGVATIGVGTLGVLFYSSVCCGFRRFM
jgi:hypothetical protein